MNSSIHILALALAVVSVVGGSWLPGAMKRLGKEAIALGRNPPDFCGAGSGGEDPFHWEGFCYGPPGSPYEEGVFLLDIQFPENYPFSPPKVCNVIYFLEKIFNVSLIGYHLKYYCYSGHGHGKIEPFFNYI